MSRPTQSASPQLELLVRAGRLLLEYNESGRETQHALGATARSFSQDECRIVISYGSICMSLGHEGPVLSPVGRIRFNTAVQARVLSILAGVRNGELGLADANRQLQRVERDTPHHSRWLTAALLALAAGSLARLLGADVGAQYVAASATGLGLLIRQELGRWGLNALALPFVAALVSGVVGSVSSRLGWTGTPGLAIIVPALVLVPGPHIINGVLDVIDDFVLLGLARMTLAGSCLVSTAIGVVAGMALVLQEFPKASPTVSPDINVLLDMLLAGVVACGFAMAYNTAPREIAMAAIGGMAGHGLRYVALQGDWRLDAATWLGGICVGVISGCFARSFRTPVAVVAFAGAVTMMPGLQIYHAIGGALRLAQMSDAGDSALLLETAGCALQAASVCGALAVGVIVGVRAVNLLAHLFIRAQGSHGLQHESPGPSSP